MSTIYGGSGNDLQFGTLGADSIFGYGGNDTINASSGNDTIYGGDGADSINAGSGSDLVFAEGGNDTVVASTGHDTVFGGAGNDNLSGGSDIYDDIYGGTGDDSIYGGSFGENWVFGGEGNDLVYAGAGQGDIATGGIGNDTVYAGSGDDTALGGTGNDFVYGEAGNDFVAGDDGHDTVDGGIGADTVEGGQGNDSLIGGDGADLIRGDIRTFDPTFFASGPSDTATTVTFTNTSALTVKLYYIDQSGTLQLYATLAPGQSWAGNTFVEHNWMLTDAATGDSLAIYDGGINQTNTFSQSFNDTISGGQGADTIYGDFGDDTIDGGTENDSIFGGLGNDTVSGTWGDDYADLGDGDDSFGNWSSEGGNDTVYGGAGNDVIYGGGENDLIFGGTGDDTFSGGAGNDSAYGGAGNDVALITDDHNQDFYDLGENAGDADALWFGNYISANGVAVTFSGSDAGSYTFNRAYATGGFVGVEGISGTEYADTLNAAADADGVTLWGNGGADYITGGSGTDLIYGGSGSDTIYYGLGDDTIYGGDGNDVIDDIGGVMGDVYLNLVDAGAGDDTVWTGGGADTIYGGAGNDLLNGEAGNDLIEGGGGNDTLYGDDGDDTLDGGQGADVLDGGAGNDVLDLTTADFANDVAYGGWGSDTLTTRIDLDGGNDTLYGGDGRDVFVAGAGDSIVGGEGGDDFDTIDLSSIPTGLTITLSGNGTGSATASGATLTFTEIEAITGTSNADTIYGGGDSWGMSYSTGGGNDSVTGGSGADTVLAGSGDDTVYGGDGADSLNGEGGHDLLLGGAGNDLLSGGSGNDTLEGWIGNDTLTGGAGFDQFTLVEAGGADTIADFDVALSGGLTADQLDVSALQNPDGSPVKGWDVSIADDGSGNTVLTFPEGESVLLQGVNPALVAAPGMLAAMGVPCLAAGTRILTPQGPRLIEKIVAGDLVTLADGGAAPVLWAGHRHLDEAELAARPGLRPIRIRAGSHGALRDLLLSPQHAVAVSASQGRALVRAGHLGRLKWAARQTQGTKTISYHHLLLPRHALILAEGVQVETLYPGRIALTAFLPADRADLLATLAAHCRPGPGQSPYEVYGPRCLPLLSFAAAQRWQAQSRPVLAFKKNHLPETAMALAL